MKVHDETAIREVERKQGARFRFPFIGLLQAAKVTLRTMLSRSVTVHYPEERIELPERSRQVIALLEENCTVCMLCAKECPCWCIYIEGHKEQKPGRRKPVNELDRFAIDYGLCMYCGICVEVCPFDALHWAPFFEYTSYSYEGLIHELEVLAEWEHHVLPPPELVEDADEKAREKAAEAHSKRAEGVWAIIREQDKKDLYMQRMAAETVAMAPPVAAPPSAPASPAPVQAPSSDTPADEAPPESVQQPPAAPQQTPESAPSPQAPQPQPTATTAAAALPRIDIMNLPAGIGPVERGRLKKLAVLQERGQAPPPDLLEKLKPILDQMRG